MRTTRRRGAMADAEATTLRTTRRSRTAPAAAPPKFAAPPPKFADAAPSETLLLAALLLASHGRPFIAVSSCTQCSATIWLHHFEMFFPCLTSLQGGTAG